MNMQEASPTQSGRERAPRLSQAWPAFIERLVVVLSDLAEDQILILSKKHSSLFVQFVGQGAFGIRMETISNHYRSPTEQLDDQQTSRLRGIGWQSPTGDPDNRSNADDPDGSPNFFVEEPAPVNCQKLSEICVATLTNILRVVHPGQLEYEAFDSHGNEIALSKLMLKRQTKQDEHEEALRSQLLTALAEVTGLQDLEFNEDGVVGGISYGSISTYVSFSNNSPQFVRWLGVLETNVKPTQKLLKWLNRINTGTENLHLFHSEGTLFARSEILATPFMHRNIEHAMQRFCEKVDEINALFRDEFSEYLTDISKSPSQFKH